MPATAKITVGAIPRDCPGENDRDVAQPQGVAPTGDALLLPDAIQHFEFRVVILNLFGILILNL